MYTCKVNCKYHIFISEVWRMACIWSILEFLTRTIHFFKTLKIYLCIKKMFNIITKNENV